MKWTMERVLGAALLAGLAFGSAACSESAASEDEASGLQTEQVTRGDLDIRVEAAGQIEPITVVEVKSKASGEILDLHVETGDRVARGALLAEVDPRDVRNALEQARADLDVAQARVDVARAQRERAEELREANVVTEQEYESAVLEAANARAALVKARTNLQLAQERSGDVTIRAPIAGTVIERPVEVGQIIASASLNVSGGTTLMLMADLSEMQVRTLVDETDIGRVRAGQTARVTVEAYSGRTFTGSVHKIEPQAVVEQNVTMFPVLVRLDNREGLLKPLMNAEVQIEVASRSDVILVPNAAVVSMADAMAAGAMFGLEIEEMRRQLRGAGFAGRGGGRPGQRAGPADTPGEGAAGEDAARGARDTSGAGAGTDPAAEPAEQPAAGDRAAGANADCRALLARARQDRAALSDEERARVRECIAQRRGPAAATADGGGAGPGASGTGGGADNGAALLGAEPRPAVVFVDTPDGPEPRTVLLGMNDWDRTEVIRGLEAGEEVVLISVARLQQQQEELMNRIRSRTGFPGTR